MVDIPRQEILVNPNYSSSFICDHRVQCIQQGLGCSVEWPDLDRRNLVSTGTGPSHQLPGVIGSVSSIASIREDLVRYSSALPFGQCNSSNIHQPERRHSLQTAVPTSNHNLELVHGKEYLCHGRTLAGSLQYNSGRGATHSPGSLRLDAQLACISENSGNSGPFGGGPVCLLPDQTTSSLLQLESRPGSHGDRCIHAELVSTTRVCQSSMVFDSPLSLQGENTISMSSVNHSPNLGFQSCWNSWRTIL